MISEERLYQLVGERLRKLRTRERLTQAELAAQIGLERTSITNIEKGVQKVPLHILFRACALFKVPITDVVPPVGDVQTGAPATSALQSLTVGQKEYRVEPGLKEVLSSLISS